MVLAGMETNLFGSCKETRAMHGCIKGVEPYPYPFVRERRSPAKALLVHARQGS